MARTRPPTPKLDPLDVRTALGELLRVAIRWERQRRKIGRRSVRDRALLLQSVTDAVAKYKVDEVLMDAGKNVVTDQDRSEVLPIWAELTALCEDYRARRATNPYDTAVKTFPGAIIAAMRVRGWRGREARDDKVRSEAATALMTVLADTAERPEAIAAGLMRVAGYPGLTSLVAKKQKLEQAQAVHRMSFVHDEDMIAYLIVILGTRISGAKKIARDLWADPHLEELARAANEARADHVKLGKSTHGRRKRGARGIGL